MGRYPRAERVSRLDLLRVTTGAVSLVSGLAILVQLLSLGFNTAAVVAALAFAAFGIYRLTVAARRYQEYRLRARGR